LRDAKETALRSNGSVRDLGVLVYDYYLRVGYAGLSRICDRTFDAAVKLSDSLYRERQRYDRHPQT
jgi:hypothetical protein